MIPFLTMQAAIIINKKEKKNKKKTALPILTVNHLIKQPLIELAKNKKKKSSLSWLIDLLEF